jgi:hypothetical protein
MIRKTGRQNKIAVRFHKIILCFDEIKEGKRRVPSRRTKHARASGAAR